MPSDGNIKLPPNAKQYSVARAVVVGTIINDFSLAFVRPQLPNSVGGFRKAWLQGCTLNICNLNNIETLFCKIWLLNFAKDKSSNHNFSYCSEIMVVNLFRTRLLSVRLHRFPCFAHGKTFALYTSVRTNSQTSTLSCKSIDRNGLSDPSDQDENVFRFLSLDISLGVMENSMPSDDRSF